MEVTKIGDIGLLRDVLIEEIAHPLVSVMKRTDNGFSVNFKIDGAEISLASYSPRPSGNTTYSSSNCPHSSHSIRPDSRTSFTLSP
jgi:hypothetical protein